VNEGASVAFGFSRTSARLRSVRLSPDPHRVSGFRRTVGSVDLYNVTTRTLLRDPPGWQ